jgi:DNA-binding response OmpR family regulator
MAPNQHGILESPEENHAGCGRVLIVDHDEKVLTVMKRLLGDAPYNTVTARGGLKALPILCQGTFDLVLVDDKLLDVSSEELVRQIRSASTRTPVVVMQSAPHTDDLAVRYAQLGVCFFINRDDPEGIAVLVHDHFLRTRFLCTHS